MILSGQNFSPCFHKPQNNRVLEPSLRFCCVQSRWGLIPWVGTEDHQRVFCMLPTYLRYAYFLLWTRGTAGTKAGTGFPASLSADQFLRSVCCWRNSEQVLTEEQLGTIHLWGESMGVALSSCCCSIVWIQNVPQPSQTRGFWLSFVPKHVSESKKDVSEVSGFGRGGPSGGLGSAGWALV